MPLIVVGVFYEIKFEEQNYRDELAKQDTHVDHLQPVSMCFCSDPPSVSVEGTSTPALEYTTRKITCRTSGGNPSDPRSYDYQWMYMAPYNALAREIPVSHGMFKYKILMSQISLRQTHFVY